MRTEIKPVLGKKKKVAPGRAANSVRVAAAAFNQLTAHAKKLDVTNGEYASAAIAFFAESGLDPTAERPENLAAIGSKLNENNLTMRKQNVDIGGRLISIMRAWEKSLYTFLQQQQGSTNMYLELIESNLLRHQVAVETTLLAPMIEQLFKSNVEAYINRGLVGETYLKVMGKSLDLMREQDLKLNGDRDGEVTKNLREFIKTNSIAAPQPTNKPAVIPIPKIPVFTTAAPAPPAPAAPTP